MAASHVQATSPTEAFWTLDPRASVPPGHPWFIDFERLISLGHLEVLRTLELGSSTQQTDLALVLPVRVSGDGPEVVRPEVAAAIERMLEARVVLPAVFDEPQACVRALARWSGGHVRHLLLLARRAVENTEPERITVTDIDKAGYSLGVQLVSRLRPEDLPRAVELHRTYSILPTEQDRRMLERACVLPYGGETVWWDVHPAVVGQDLFRMVQRRQGHEQYG